MFPITIIEAFLFTFPCPLFASVMMRVFRLIAFLYAFFKIPVAMTYAIMFLCLCFCLRQHWAWRFRLLQMVRLGTVLVEQRAGGRIARRGYGIGVGISGR